MRLIHLSILQDYCKAASLRSRTCISLGSGRGAGAARCDITKCRVTRRVWTETFYILWGPKLQRCCGHFKTAFEKRKRQSPVTLNDLLAVSDGLLGVLHVETHPHSLVHHVQHVDVGVVEDGAHLLQALLAHLQQLTRGCQRVKVAPDSPAADHTSKCWPQQRWGQVTFVFFCPSSNRLVKVKDIFTALQGTELCNTLPCVAHHVVDDLWLDGVAALVHFQLCLVLESWTMKKSWSHTHSQSITAVIIIIVLHFHDSRLIHPLTMDLLLHSWQSQVKK